MTRHQRDRNEPRAPRAVVLFLILLPVSIVADVIDFFCYWSYLEEQGLSLWSFEGPGRWEYWTTLPGITWTLLGIAPWLLILGWLFYPRKLPG